MRLGFKYVDVDVAAGDRTDLDSTVENFRESNAYDELRFETRDEFLAYCNTRWVRELNEALQHLLDKKRSVISIGSGKGEHEVPLFLDGYDVVASEIVPDALDDAARLFPGFKTIYFDVLDPPQDVTYDDALMTGLDAPFDDRQLEQALRNTRGILNPGGRIIFVLRYPANPATWVIDRVLLPGEAMVRRGLHRHRGDGKRVVRRKHGYRRRPQEVIALAERCGLRAERVGRAAYGMELQRIGLAAGADRLLAAATRADRRLKMLSSATVFEFLS